MLVLTRRIGEEIVIGGEIRVQVISAQGGRIRLGVQAPANVSVDRSEVHVRRIGAVDSKPIASPCAC